eukprot:CAMPEP_0172684808 /NCGR_PEP_ID=MMETSP1074-20121228/19817_1 /TAXON_ID=2916 /ORGANISM="Ceratium fusus, Strain PA161109" /LENGTH=147 /DNA_ID=CAMNT_0013503875 /DNA_START=453 /DNA_END=896 /DNA_ORIENTATION=+
MDARKSAKNCFMPNGISILHVCKIRSSEIKHGLDKSRIPDKATMFLRSCIRAPGPYGRKGLHSGNTTPSSKDDCIWLKATCALYVCGPTDKAVSATAAIKTATMALSKALFTAWYNGPMLTNCIHAAKAGVAPPTQPLAKPSPNVFL